MLVMLRGRSKDSREDAFKAGIEALLSFYAPDVVCYPAAGWVPEPVCHGHDGIRRLSGRWVENVDGATLNVHEIRDLSERVLVLAELTGQARDSGEPISQPFGIVNSDLREGKVFEARFFLSWQEAREAAVGGSS
jgi:hypothetical protein